jgi:hypothetical protein
MLNNLVIQMAKKKKIGGPARQLTKKWADMSF